MGNNKPELAKTRGVAERPKRVTGIGDGALRRSGDSGDGEEVTLVGDKGTRPNCIDGKDLRGTVLGVNVDGEFVLAEMVLRGKR